jgi:hypothetical protein
VRESVGGRDRGALPVMPDCMVGGGEVSVLVWFGYGSRYKS